MIKTVLSTLLVTVTLWGADGLQTTTESAVLINDPKVVVVDVSDPKTYLAEGHLHGAVRTDISEWRIATDKHMSVKSASEIQSLMRRLGINSDSKILLYSHLNTPKDLLSTSYIYWAMKLYGANDVMIMDGGFKQWEKEKRFNVHDDVKNSEGNFTAVIDSKRLADRSYVQRSIGNVAMIDARPPENYFGIKASDGVERLGHIPGAMSYFWMYSVTPELASKPKAELEKIFSQGFALSKHQEIILYCTGGLETSYNYFLLSAVLGYTNVKLYDGSMREWGNLPDTPMIQYKWEHFTPTVEVVKIP